MSGQLLLGGMPTRLFTCTPSKLASFRACPRKYRHTYLDRPTPPRGGAWAHTSVGAAVHNVLRALWDEPVGRRTPAIAAALLRANWPIEGFRDDAQRAAMLEVAGGWLERYVADVDVTEPPRGVERVVALKTQTLALSGRIDRLDERGEELVVVDYKTGRHLLSVIDARSSMAMALYALAAARSLRQPCVRVELHHVPSGEVLVWEHSAQALGRMLRRAEDIAADALAATARLAAGEDPDAAFPTSVSSMCTWCDFHRHCREGRAVGRRQQSWAGLPEEVRGDR